MVVGCGAVGGLYGGRLAAAGLDVSFLVRTEASAAALRDGGLRIDSPDGDVVLAPGSFGVATDPAALGVADVVVVALKSTANGVLGSVLPPLVGPGTTVAVFQNGLGVDEAAGAAAPAAGAVVGAMCFVCSALAGPGHVVHQDYGAVTLGAARGGVDAAEAVAADLRAAGFEATASADLVTARWRKLLWNIPFNGLVTLLGLPTDRLLADPAGRALAEAVMAEVVAGARACGAALGEQDATDMVALTEAMVPYLPSMALDHAAGRPLEHEAIHGEPVRTAAAAGVAMPRVELLYRALAVLDRNQATSTER